MIKKVLTYLILGAGLLAIFFTVFEVIKLSNAVLDFASPTGSPSEKKAQAEDENSKVSKTKNFSILLLGIDRRHKSETGFRTDVMILASVNLDKKKIVLTSVPRDLWVLGGRINATYVAEGFPAMQDSFEEITGLRPSAFIRCDFEDLVWIVDSFGGVNVNLDTAFTDYEYPNDVTKVYYTVSFPAGEQLVSGSDALVLSRSRHGNNGEGSDFKRMLRQHKILKAMPEAILSPRSVFNPFNIEKFYELVTERMVTDLSLNDAKLLWSFYSDRGTYTIDSFLVDSTFLYNPPMAEYGGAWVLVPINNDYTPIHTALKQKLGLL